MEGKTLMEAGCGRGGGLRYIADRYRPRIAIGVDFNQNQVRLNLTPILDQLLPQHVWEGSLQEERTN